MTVFLRRYPLLLALALVLGLFSNSALVQPESRAYQLENRPGEDVAVQIRELYQGSPVTVTAQGQQLVVRGEPALLDEIGRLVDPQRVVGAAIAREETVHVARETLEEPIARAFLAQDGVLVHVAAHDPVDRLGKQVDEMALVLVGAEAFEAGQCLCHRRRSRAGETQDEDRTQELSFPKTLLRDAPCEA